MEKNSPDIQVMPQSVFDEMCETMNVNDGNVETDFKDCAFISIIGTPECLKYYLEEETTKHWFKNNHVNVINLEFDDIPCDEFEWYGHVFKGMSDEQAKILYKFICDNIGKDFYIHCRAGRSRSMAVGTYIRDFYKDVYNREYYTLFEGSNRDVYRKLSRMYYKQNGIYK